jgi:hypothetical protein
LAVNDLSVDAFDYYHDNPVEACKDLLNIELDAWQVKATNALFKDHFVAIRAGSGVGKSIWASAMSMLFLSTRPYSIIPTTAPSQHQLNDVLWGNHYKHIQGSPFLQECLSWTQTKVSVKGYEPSWYAVARTARVNPGGTVSEGLQGFHAPELLFVLDEASGIPDAVFAAVEGALTEKNAYVILISNPTRLSGYFYDIFNNSRMQKFYKIFHVSCYDSKFVEERYIQMMETKWGKDHPIFQIKVLGDFPSSDIFLMFPPEDIDVMKNNSFNYSHRGGQKRRPHQIGIDIGRTTAKTVACIRYENVIRDWSELGLRGTVTDKTEILNWAIQLILTYNPEKVVIDATGIGSGVYDDLKRLYPSVVHPFYGQARPEESKRDRYANLRAQAHWEFRELLRSLFCVNPPEKFLDDLLDIRYKLKNDKILIESKEEIMRRSGKSPDYSDAAIYAFVNPDLCVDKYDVILNPFALKGLNEGMKKTNIWASNYTESSKSERRFGIFHA